MKHKYIAGEKLGPCNIEFIEEIPSKDGKHRYGRFICPKCHSKNMITRIDAVKTGNTKQCQECVQHEKMSRCLSGNMRKNDLVGKKFGHLTVVADDGSRKKMDNFLQ